MNTPQRLTLIEAKNALEAAGYLHFSSFEQSAYSTPHDLILFLNHKAGTFEKVAIPLGASSHVDTFHPAPVLWISQGNITDGIYVRN